MKTNLYALTDAEGVVRYIGKTSKDPSRRLITHISEARRGGRGHKCNWIRLLLRCGREPRVLPLIQVDGDGSTDEIMVIAAFRAGKFQLTNSTSGGEGRAGVPRTAAEREFLSKFHKGRKITWGAKISAAKRGVKFSAEHRQKLSDARRRYVAGNDRA